MRAQNSSSVPNVFGMQSRHEIEDLRLDVIHVRPVGDPDPVVLDRALLELRERLLNLLTHVGLGVVAIDPDTVASDVDLVTHRGECLHHGPGLGGERAEFVRVVVRRHVLPEADETA